MAWPSCRLTKTTFRPLGISTEAKLCVEIARTMIFPAAVRYQNELAMTCTNLKALGYTFDTDTLDEITRLVKGLQDSTTALEKSSMG